MSKISEYQAALAEARTKLERVTAKKAELAQEEADLTRAVQGWEAIISLERKQTGDDVTAMNNVSLKISQYIAELLYAGPAPGFPGLMQINARVPGGFLSPGVQPVVLSAGSAVSQDGVTIAVR